MRKLLAVLLAQSVSAAAFAAPVIRSVPVKIVPIVTVPILLNTGIGTTVLGLTQTLTIPRLTAISALVPIAPNLAPVPAVADVMWPNAIATSLVPITTLTNEISQQQAAAGGDVLAAAPDLGTFFDGSLRIAGAGDAYRGLSPPAAAPAPIRALESIKELRFGTYNVENLFQSVGKYEPDLDSPGKRDKVSSEKPKPEWQLQGVAQAILDSNLDIVSVEEVENIQALEDFNEKYLGGQYKTMLIEGNDERGIDIGFLVKKEIPFQLEHRTNKDEMWIDPEGGGQPQKLFSRDLPELIVRAPGRAQPLFVYLGTHYKSKRPRSHNDPTSEKLRRVQVQRTAEIIGRLRKEFGQDVPLMLGGDFNGAVNEDATFDALKGGGAGLTDVFDQAQPPLKALERVTHTYHPNGAPAHKSQMDAIFISQTMRGLVAMTKVYRYKDADGKEKPLPETFEDRAKNPSDHFPLLLTLRFQPLLHP